VKDIKDEETIRKKSAIHLLASSALTALVHDDEDEDERSLKSTL